MLKEACCDDHCERTRSPRRLSFTVAIQSIAAGWLIMVLSDDAQATLLIDAASVSLAAHVVGNRPRRLEPRAVKRRAKPHDLLTKPRAQERAEMIGAESP